MSWLKMIKSPQPSIIGKPLVRINAVASHLCSMLYQPYVIYILLLSWSLFCPLIVNYLDSGIIIQFSLCTYVFLEQFCVLHVHEAEESMIKIWCQYICTLDMNLHSFRKKIHMLIIILSKEARIFLWLLLRYRNWLVLWANPL